MSAPPTYMIGPYSYTIDEDTQQLILVEVGATYLDQAEGREEKIEK